METLPWIKMRLEAEVLVFAHWLRQRPSTWSRFIISALLSHILVNGCRPCENKTNINLLPPQGIRDPFGVLNMHKIPSTPSDSSEHQGSNATAVREKGSQREQQRQKGRGRERNRARGTVTRKRHGEREREREIKKQGLGKEREITLIHTLTPQSTEPYYKDDMNHSNRQWASLHWGMMPGTTLPPAGRPFKLHATAKCQQCPPYGLIHSGAMLDRLDSKWISSLSALVNIICR